MGKNITIGTQLAMTRFNQKSCLSTTITVDELEELLTDKTFLDDLALLFTDYAQYVLSLRWYPFSASMFANISPSSYLVLGNKTTTLSVNLFNGISTARKIGSVNLTRKYYDFLDYEPYTSAQIYLPYLGFYSLPVNECMNKTIDVYYAVDFDTGIATAYLQIENRVILTANGKVGVDIPIGSSNANEIAKNNLANGMKLVASGVAIAGGISSGNLVGGMVAVKGVETAVSTGINTIQANQEKIQRGSLTGGMDGIASPTDIYIIVKRPNPLTTNKSYLASLKGIPYAKVETLSVLSGGGFAVVEDIHLERLGYALSTEVDEIESLLHEGVIF